MFLVRNMFLVKDTPQTQYWRGFAADWARCFSVKAACTNVKAACTNVKRPALTSSGLH